MASLFSVIWTKTAREDLNSIIDYIAADSINYAITVFKKIKKKTGELIKFPSRGRIVPELKFHNIENYREIIISPWRIIYRIEDDKVFIFAIFDSRRNLQDILLERLLKK